MTTKPKPLKVPKGVWLVYDEDHAIYACLKESDARCVKTYCGTTMRYHRLVTPKKRRKKAK